MAPPPSIDRIRSVWQRQAGPVREQAAFSLLIAVIIGGAHVSRLGTPWARALTAAAILDVLALPLGLWIARRREAASTRLTVRRVVLATDPSLGARALRAHSLALRAEFDESVGSHELAVLHLSRLLDRISSDSVQVAATRYRARFRGVSVALLSIAALVVVLSPSRVVEGLDVLAARAGRAPFPMSFVSYPRLVAQPPPYTRESERTLVFGTSVDLPQGSVITVRGVPSSPGHRLVVTDGERDESFSDDGASGIVARYVVRSNVSLRIAARFGEVRVEDGDSLDVTVIPDAPPSVEVEGAPRRVRLVDLDGIDVRWLAKDDHGIREVDLVMRSGAREERRVLARFDGETKIERGGRVITPRDAFLRRMFLPVSVTAEVKDNDPLDGPKWNHSAAILVVPPEVGQAEAARLVGLRSIRDALVDLLANRSGTGDVATAVSSDGKETRERLAKASEHAEEIFAGTYGGTPMPRPLVLFIRGQLDKLRGGRGDVAVHALEEGALAVDAAIAATGNRDAVDVAKRLGDVAEEAAVCAHGAQKPESGAASERLDASLDALVRGACHLETLASLGADLGGVALGDAGRIRRARDARDFIHAELAALHLAERLRRPSPSFGATTGSHHGKGVESGTGNGGNGLPSPSSANEDFDRAANAISQLAEEHKGTLRGVESALEEASHAEPTDAQRGDAKRLADAIRRAIDPLPLPGQEFGSPRAAAALAREHANAAAHALDDLSLAEAKESGEAALGALDQAEKSLDPTDPARGDFAQARHALREAVAFADRELARRRADAEARAGSAIREAGDTERALAERAEKLGDVPGGHDTAIPRELAERLNRAGSVMREAAKELAEGHGDRGTALQREAQRLLDEARPERSREPVNDGDGEDEQGNPSKARADDDSRGENGRAVATGGDVPAPDEKAHAEEFRKRVLEGLGREKSERLSPAVQRYAEGLLR